MRTKHLPKDHNPKEHIDIGFLNLKLHLNYDGQPILAVKKNLKLSSYESSVMSNQTWF